MSENEYYIRIDEGPDIYEKARRAGLDEAHIQRSQQSMHTGMAQQVAIHDSHYRVLLFALAYDHPGKTVTLPWLGMGLHQPKEDKEKQR